MAYLFPALHHVVVGDGASGQIFLAKTQRVGGTDEDGDVLGLETLPRHTFQAPANSNNADNEEGEASVHASCGHCPGA